MSLEIMTCRQAGIDSHSIHGPLEDLARLARLVEDLLATLEPGASAAIRERYAPGSEYSLLVDLKDDSFDPAAADEWLAAESVDVLLDSDGGSQ
jgi:hypothetical protein